MPRLIRGDKLSEPQQRMALNAFVYRWTTGNTQRASAYGYCPHCKTRGGKPSVDNVACRRHHPTVPLQTDAEWLAEHAFYVNKDGSLSGKPGRCEPAFMAEAR
jgi:hypothetical protein